MSASPDLKMKSPVKTFVIGFLLVIGLSLGSFAVMWGTELKLDNWSTRRILDLVVGVVLMLICAWWLVDRSSKSQLFKTLALTIAVAGLGGVLGAQIQLSRLPDSQLKTSKTVKGLIFMVIASSALIYIGAEKKEETEPLKE